MKTIVAALIVCGLVAGCRRQAPRPAPGAPVPAGGPMLVEIRGSMPALDALPALKGILISGHGQEQLADGTWAVKAYLSSADLVDAIRARGLGVKVLQTPEQMAHESEDLARQLEARERRDAGTRH
jgi:hypothetical protein